MTPPLFHPSFRGVPVGPHRQRWVQPEPWNYFGSIQPVWKTYLNVRDRRTDRRTTYCGITALCIASRGKNKPGYVRVRPTFWLHTCIHVYVWRTRLSTVGDRAFPVAATRLWNSLPSHITASPLSPSSAVVLNHISSHFLMPKIHYTRFSVSSAWILAFIPLSDSHLYSVLRAVTGHRNCYYIWRLFILYAYIVKRTNESTSVSVQVRFMRKTQVCLQVWSESL